MTVQSGLKISRRTLVKGAAWAVPVVAVAAAAPFAAASGGTTTPTFGAGRGCATTGVEGHGCAGKDKTGQVPIAVTNTTGSTLYFQVLATKSWIWGKAEPSAWNTSTSNNPFSVWTDNGTENHCTPQVIDTRCGGYLSIAAAPGQTLNLWIVDQSLGSSSAFQMKVQFRWVDAACNVVIASDIADSGEIESKANCA